MADVVIDTDVASVLPKGRAPDWVHRRLVGARVWLTFITVGELWKWAEVRSWGVRTRSRDGDLDCRTAGHPLRRGDRPSVGLAGGAVAAPWSAAASERHVDRRVLASCTV